MALRVFLGFISLLVAGLCSAASPVLDRVIERGVLQVALSADQPPYNFRTRDGSVVGFDVELAQALADAMQVKLELVAIPFGDLLSNLLDGRADLVISGMAITPKRSLRVRFVGPYALSGKSMLTTIRVKDLVEDVAVFNDPEVRVVALKNSTSESFVQRNLSKAALYPITNYDEGIQMLLTGRVDAMVADLPILKFTLVRYPDAGLDIIEPPLSVEPIGVAIPASDAHFEHLVRHYMSFFETTGLTARLYQKWFEDDDWMALLP